jgi:K+-sensing histidine kinase KdpD
MMPPLPWGWNTRSSRTVSRSAWLTAWGKPAPCSSAAPLIWVVTQQAKVYKNGREVLLTIISDDGGGIAGADLPNIFNRFYRGANAGENSAGIGLALAKAIFNAQGGDISVRSQPGAGTSFEIRLFHGVV